MSERTIQNGYLIAAQSDIEALRLRVKKLESLARAADRMRALKFNGAWLSTIPVLNAYDTQRAAVGEIGEE